MIPARFTASRVLRTAAVLLLMTGCKNCGGGKPTTDNGTGDNDVASVSTRVTVQSIDPSRVQENTAFGATVRGSNFQSGASVSFGVQEASTVTYLNSSQLAIQVSGGLPAGRYDVEVSNPDGSSAVLRGGLIVDGQAVATCESATVWFDTDKSTLNADAQGTLTNRASCYANAGATIRVEGHCDERGTTDYNLALGERRAKSVKDFLVGKGVPNDRVQTLSFGEEQPVDGSNNESAWSKNRRAEVSASR